MYREAKLEQHLRVESLHVVLLRRRFDFGIDEAAHRGALVLGASDSPRLAPIALLNVPIDQMRCETEQRNAVIDLLIGLARRCEFL